MARPLRIELPDGVYHVTSRGLKRREIVCDDRDRRRWLELLAAVATRRRWPVFAWVLMGNHYHLFLQTPDADLSAGMHLSRRNLTPREEMPMIHPAGETDAGTLSLSKGRDSRLGCGRKAGGGMALGDCPRTPLEPFGPSPNATRLMEDEEAHDEGTAA